MLAALGVSVSQTLVEIRTFIPKTGEALSFFFEPRGEDLTFEEGQAVTIFAKCPDGEKVDLPAEFGKDGDSIIVHSQSGNALWYTASAGAAVSTLQQACGKRVSDEIESALLEKHT